MDYSCLLALADLTRNIEPIIYSSFLDADLISAFFELHLTAPRNVDAELKQFFVAYKSSLERIRRQSPTRSTANQALREHVLQMVVQLYSLRQAKLEKLYKSLDLLPTTRKEEVVLIIEKVVLASKSEVKYD